MDPGWTQDGIRNRLLRLDARRRIYERLLHKPGIHLRRLSRELSIPVGTLEHHVHLMERFGIVVSHKEAKRRAFFAAEQVHAEDLPLLHALRHRAWRDLLCKALLHEGRSALELAADVGLPNASHHLRALTRAGHLQRLAIGRDSLYRVAHPDRLRRILEIFGPTYRNLDTGTSTPPDPVFQALVDRSRAAGASAAMARRAVFA